jgi:small subunit ribosomal protein S4e
LGTKGASTGLKRKPAPRFWPIHRKEDTWVVKPSPGPHSSGGCMPLALVLRDYLGFAKTRKEAKKIVSEGRVYVDGVVRRNDDFPVGLADVISILDVEKSFRVWPSKKGLILYPIGKEEATFKLCRIEDKRIASKGNVQLNLHDGSTILVKVANTENLRENAHKTLDTLKLNLPDRQIVESVKMREKDFVVITGGKNVGERGRIVEIEKAEGKKRRNALVTIEDERGGRYQTILNFVFALGETQPLISMPEVV